VVSSYYPAQKKGIGSVVPPVLEVFVLWHPADEAAGGALMKRLLEHFHGNAYSGLLGGAIEVFARSQGWASPDDAPRPLPRVRAAAPSDVPATELTAVVVWMGLGLARAIESGGSPWATWLETLRKSQVDEPGRLQVFPIRPVQGGAGASSRLCQLIPNQAITDGDRLATCRDLTQGIAQWAAQMTTASDDRLKVFISHTKHDVADSQRVSKLIAQVRSRIDGASRLGSFFDSNALQPGEDWAEHLREGTSRMALLALRTDLYASREWCQREMLLAKRHGVPVVVLDALERGEERGSFLMDHVTRVPVRANESGWEDQHIDIGLARLVDACLQRELWRRQSKSTNVPQNFQVDWWSAQAPEPATLVAWLSSAAARDAAPGTAVRVAAADRQLCILHPDPPLGPEECDVLERIAKLAGWSRGLDIVTPRILAARGA